MAKLPTNDLVAISWIKTLDGIPSSKVATTLPLNPKDPNDNSSWEASGFITVMTVGGQPQRHLPVRQPVVQVTCWATNTASGKPPWGKANELAATIVEACYEQSNFGRVATPAAFEDVRVMSAYPLVEPYRVPGDGARFAIYRFDLAMHWVRVPS